MAVRPRIFSRLRLCAGDSSSSKMTVSASTAFDSSRSSSALPLPTKVAGSGSCRRWRTRSASSAPAVSARAASSSSDVSASSTVAGGMATPTRTSVSRRAARSATSAGHLTYYVHCQIHWHIDCADVLGRAGEDDGVAREADGGVAARLLDGDPGRRPCPTPKARAAAQAPVPHAIVSPTPRSHTRMVSSSVTRAGRHELHVATRVASAPARRGRASYGSCDLDDGVGVAHVDRRRRRRPWPIDLAMPMSTLTLPSVVHGDASLTPASVCHDYLGAGRRPASTGPAPGSGCRCRSSRPGSRRRCTAPCRPRRVTRIAPSAPTPRWRSHRARDRRLVDRSAVVEVEEHEEVVPQAVVLLEPHQDDQSSRRAGSTSRGFPAVPSQVIRGSRRNHARWRRAKARVRRTAASTAASASVSSPARWASSSR